MNSHLKDLKGWASTSENYETKQGIHPRRQSKNIDRKLGFKIPKIEDKLQQKYRAYYRDNDLNSRKQHYEGTQTWIGLHPQVLQTPYSDIHRCLSYLLDKEISSIVDIGAGYGRVGIVAKSLFPDVEFKGFEIIKKRSDEGNRIFQKIGLDDCSISNEDVLKEDFHLPIAQVYFIYDFSEAEDICMILDQLEDRYNSSNYYLITKGDRVDSMIERKYKFFSKTKIVKTFRNMNVYSSLNQPNDRK